MYHLELKDVTEEQHKYWTSSSASTLTNCRRMKKVVDIKKDIVPHKKSYAAVGTGYRSAFS